MLCNLETACIVILTKKAVMTVAKNIYSLCLGLEFSGYDRGGWSCSSVSEEHIFHCVICYRAEWHHLLTEHCAVETVNCVSLTPAECDRY
jgi:hypothetical protein